MELLPYIFAGVLVVLTIVMTVVGVHIVLVLRQLRSTLSKVNGALDSAQGFVQTVAVPLQQLGATASSMQTGFRVVETFVSWLQKNKQK